MTIIRGLHTFPMYSYYYWQVCDVTSIGYVAVYCLLCASIEYLFVSQSDDGHNVDRSMLGLI